jgi:hypothetical protein
MNMPLSVVALGLAMGLAGAARGEEQHPRMFVTPERLAAIRKEAAVKDSHHQKALAQLKSAVDKPDAGAGRLVCK